MKEHQRPREYTKHSPAEVSTLDSQVLLSLQSMSGGFEVTSEQLATWMDQHGIGTGIGAIRSSLSRLARRNLVERVVTSNRAMRGWRAR